MDPAHHKRIRDELKAAGVGSIGRRTPESHELAKLIHPDEHIGGAVYGTYPGGLAWLVATDQRVIFLDRKPLFATHDEMTYDYVTGITSTRAGFFETVILHSRSHDYSISFVNPKTARVFIQYVDSRRLSSGSFDHATQRYIPDPTPPTTKKPSKPVELPPAPPVPSLPDPRVGNTKEREFLREHDLGVLSTIDRTGNLDGAVVYYFVDDLDFIYILTKSGTAKGRNVYAHGRVALTIYEAETRQTLQLQGVAEVETDQTAKNNIFAQMTNPHLYGGKIELPPVTKLHEGAFMVIRITPTRIRFHDYSQREN